MKRGSMVIVVVLAVAAVVGLSPRSHAEDAGAAAQRARIAELFESSFSHEATNNYAKALADVQQIVQLAPQHYVANLRLGWLSYQKQRYDESVAAYTKAAELAPRALEPQLGMMLPLMAGKKWTSAERIGRAVLAVAPRNYLASSRLAYIAFSQGKFKEAEALYRQVLEDYPGDLEMQLGLGWTLLRLGRREEARATFAEVLGVSRQNASAKAGLEALK
ncbi:MAG: tetratricopeptide repeat protein [Deltaproteobacteria bacterium]|nr:tetratricopeptide repeat protein [Deltaproteobacteria bacterium]